MRAFDFDLLSTELKLGDYPDDKCNIKRQGLSRNFYTIQINARMSYLSNFFKVQPTLFDDSERH